MPARADATLDGKNMPRYHIWTVGCQMNEADSAKLAAMGCMVGLRSQHLQERFPFVDVFARPQAFADVLAAVLPQEDLGGEFWPSTFAEPPGPTACVPVIHGCNKFCPFCL